MRDLHRLKYFLIPLSKINIERPFLFGHLSQDSSASSVSIMEQGTCQMNVYSECAFEISTKKAK